MASVQSSFANEEKGSAAGRAWSDGEDDGPAPQEAARAEADAEEAATETVDRWQSANYVAVDANQETVEASFTPQQALQLVKATAPSCLLRACKVMVDYPDEARALSVCPSLTAMAIASIENPACAQLLAASSAKLWEIGGHCFAVLSSLLASETVARSVKQDIAGSLGQGAWGMCALRLAFLRSALQTADFEMKQALASSIWQAVIRDWQRGGPLWNALVGKEDGMALWGQIEAWCKPWGAEGHWTTSDCATPCLSADSTARPHTEESTLESIPRTPSSLGSCSPRQFESEPPMYCAVSVQPWVVQVFVPC